jgi:pimeloyl-ACP methyl ester carboxylesterase
MPAGFRRARFGLPLGAILFAAIAGPALADAVYLKDGFTLHGKVRREADVIFDPTTGQPIPVFKGNFFVVDDRVRWVIFEHRNVQDANPDVNIRRDFLEFVMPLAGGQPSQLPKAARVLGGSPFDKKWERVVKLQNEMGQYSIRQRLTQLTGYAAKLESVTYRWNVFYFTQELGLETVTKLLNDHPDLKEGKDEPPDIEKRMKRFRFLMQATFLLAADEELNRALKDIPGEKDRIERSRKVLRQAQIQAVWDEAQTANKAGRYSAIRGMLNRIPMNEVEPRLAGDIGALRTKLDSAERLARESRDLLTKLADRLAGPLEQPFAEALAEIVAALGPDTIDRLDAFMTLANQHEKEITSGKKPTYCIEDMLSLAVTGFVLGNASAEPKVAAAERLWGARQFTLNYLRTHDPATRRRALEAYLSGPGLALDEFAQLIFLLPPTDPPEATAATPNGVEERTTAVPWGQSRSVPYFLQLPLEYSPNRSWPVLIVVPGGGGERAADALDRWAYFARQNGYLLASPQWATAAEFYNFQSEEHLPVLELIRDLRRRYNVDSDRIFLAGYGDGGTITTDIALGHPDQFAGVLTVNARPRWSASMYYWHNAQYLPFYMVAGELAGDCCDKNRKLFQNWMNRGYNSLMTIYRGRPSEFYFFELPFAFDWMNRKRRSAGFPDLGRTPNAGSQGEEFQTARPGDNRFYWLEVVQHNEKYTTTAMGSGEKPYTPAALQAQIRDGNTIMINARGIKTLRVWLGQSFDAQSGWKQMVDLTKPVTFQINRQPAKTQKFTPSLGVMLEDLYERGDRQRLFWASAEFTNVQ